ncbi:MAG: DnaJ domain-containing protein, partial [Bacteroidaceae bacterium]|nr:DnaJ domain-containing protein [Bacteroidaceae bacterium]
MAFIDYYKVMGIPKDTPQKDIRAAYRKRSKQFHPDLHPDDPKAKAKFQMLNEAYEVLNDPEKRAKYDQYGENWKQADQFGGFGAGGGGGNPFEGFSFNMNGEGGMSDFFQQIFGSMGMGGTRRTRTRRASTEPSEVEARVAIDVWTALLGGELIVSTTYGKFKIKVASGTQPGKKVRLKGKGGTKSDGTPKDLIIVFDVTIPANLSDQ